MQPQCVILGDQVEIKEIPNGFRVGSPDGSKHAIACCDS